MSRLVLQRASQHAGQPVLCGSVCLRPERSGDRSGGWPPAGSQWRAASAREVPILLQDRHEGYIDWDEFEHNQCVIADNTNRNGQAVQGAGAELLSGLLRCGHCRRKLKVRYRADLPTNQYYCIRPIEEDLGGPARSSSEPPAEKIVLDRQLPDLRVQPFDVELDLGIKRPRIRPKKQL